MFAQEAVGAVLSTMVTTAVQLLELPAGSVTVRVTLLAPRSAQVKLVLLALRLTEQLSDEASSISAAAIVAAPLASRATVMFLQTAAGAMLSTTVTVAVQLAVLPSTSVAVMVTVLSPRSAQVNVVLLALRLKVQLSVVPLSRSEARMLTVPLAFRFTVMFLQTGDGATLSTTVTVVDEVDVRPEASVAV